MLHSSDHQATLPSVISSQLKCRGCGVGLKPGGDDDEALGACGFCKRRPQDLRRRPVVMSSATPEASPAPARRAPVPPLAPASQALAPAADTALESGQPFTEVDVILITKMHRLLPHRELLRILNERRAGQAHYTLELLTKKIGELGTAALRSGSSWAGTRQLLSEARRQGTLAKITEQTIDDFAVVYSLNARQVMTLKDNVLPAAEDERAERAGSAE